MSRASELFSKDVQEKAEEDPRLELKESIGPAGQTRTMLQTGDKRNAPRGGAQVQRIGGLPATGAAPKREIKGVTRRTVGLNLVAGLAGFQGSHRPTRGFARLAAAEIPAGLPGVWQVLSTLIPAPGLGGSLRLSRLVTLIFDNNLTGKCNVGTDIQNKDLGSDVQDTWDWNNGSWTVTDQQLIFQGSGTHHHHEVLASQNDYDQPISNQLTFSNWSISGTALTVDLPSTLPQSYLNPFQLPGLATRVTLQKTSGALLYCEDFNGDGKADILWRNVSGEVYIWLMNGLGIASHGSPGGVGNDWQIAGVGDFNGDGKADILWRNASGEVYIWLMNGLGIASHGSLGITDNSWQIAGVGDFNGDGKADILLRNASGEVYISLMNGLGIASQGSLGIIGNDWEIAGVGDFNGDGKADILWRNASGAVAIWLMNGLGVASSGSPGGVGNDWQIAGIGDFNGDGKADILWRNVSGEVYIWLMNGLGIASHGSPGGVGNDWQID